MRFVLACVVPAITAPCSFGQASFHELGVLPGYGSSFATAISPDGAAVVGYATRPPLDAEAFRWTMGAGMVGLGDLPGGQFNSGAEAASNGGNVVVGLSHVQSYIAFRYAAGQMVGLGCLPGGPCSSGAWGVSPDGTIVVGESSILTGSVAFRWTEATGLEPLGHLPSGPFANSAALAISADTTTIVGNSSANTLSGVGAFRWTQPLGMTALGDLTGGSIGGYALDVSADGSMVVGTSASPLGDEEAFRWVLTSPQTGAGVMTGLGDLPGGSFDSVAKGMSANGTVIVGEGVTDNGFEGFIWTEAGGMRNLMTVLTTQYNLNLAGWTQLLPSDISADGTRIVGNGTHNGDLKAFLAILGDACYPDCNGDSALSIADFGCFQSKYVLGDVYTDCTGDLQLTVADFGCFQGKYVLGCP